MIYNMLDWVKIAMKIEKEPLAGSFFSLIVGIKKTEFIFLTSRV